MMDEVWLALLACGSCCLVYVATAVLFRAVRRTRRPLHPRRNGHLPAMERAYMVRKANAYHEPYDPEEIAARDKHVCYLCGQWVLPKDQTLDHLVPLVMGGADAPFNLHVAHRSCNSAKSGRLLIEYIHRR